jgi:CubicO group peptidase (beta-lactamase class C family)
MMNSFMTRLARSLTIALVGVWLIGLAPPAARAALPAPGAEPLDTPTLTAFFDDLITRQLAEGHVVGATVAIVKDGEARFAKGYGHADLTVGRRVEADRTLFYLGSDGKIFTWTAVMQQVERGALDLHADVNAYLDFAIPATYPAPITLAQLMTHTAGFDEDLGAMMRANQREVLPLREFVTRHLPRRVYPPGEFFAYSNYGAALAGYIVERVSGQPYEEYITQHILAPLGMEHSTAVQPLPPALAADLSKGYRYRAGAYDAIDTEWVAAAPAAPVRATATDMARFMIALLEGGRHGEARVLQAGTLEVMQRQQFTHDPRLPGMSYGLPISRENGQHILWHGGETARFKTLVALLPEHRLGLLVSYNTAAIDATATLSAFLDRFYPAPPALGTPSSGDSATAARLVGTYLPMRVAHATDQKLVTWLGAPRATLAADGTLRIEGQRFAEIEPGLFHQVDGERLLTYRADEQGRVTHLFRGPFAYVRLPWYATPSVHLAALLGVLAVCLSALVAWPIDALARRLRRSGALPRAARLARWVAGLLGALGLGLTAWFVVLMLGFADSLVYPESAMATLTRLAWLAVPLALGCVVSAGLAWRRHLWGLGWRLHYSLVALAGIGLVTWLGYWNLLGV